MNMKKIMSILLVVVTLTLCIATPAIAANHPFTDVPDNAWYAGYVQFVYEKNLMNGTAADKFSPQMKMNRAMLVTVLYRMDGSKTASGTMPFTDIDTGAYYYHALVWAYQNGIINGTAADKFSPSMPITREMMVTIFYRYAQHKGMDVSKLDDLAGYTDAEKISNYAKVPFRWAVAAGVINGISATTLDPLGTATRAQCAAIIERFYKLAEPTDPKPTDPTDPTEPIDPPAPVKELTGIEVVLGEDAKLVYNVGDALDMTEVVVYGVYSDGSKGAVTGYAYEADLSKAGKATVTITYEGFTAGYEVEVVEKVPEVERLNMKEASEKGNAHAIEVGFLEYDDTMTPTENCVCNETAKYYNHGYVMENGGQAFLNTLAEKAAEEFRDHMKAITEGSELLSDDAWKNIVVNVYVSWCDYVQGYKIRVLYR